MDRPLHGPPPDLPLRPKRGAAEQGSALRATACGAAAARRGRREHQASRARGHGKGEVRGHTSPAPSGDDPHRCAPQRPVGRSTTRASSRVLAGPSATSSRPSSVAGCARRLRTKFQAVALLVREERARIKADTSRTEAQRADQLKRIDGIATILAKTAARETSLLKLLDRRGRLLDGARAQMREMQVAAGLEPTTPETAPQPTATAFSSPSSAISPSGRCVPQSVVSRQLANPFLAPDYSAAPRRGRRAATARRLGAARTAAARLRAAAGGAPSCMTLPEPTASSLRLPGGLELMRHQAQVVAAAAAGHRTFLLADEPGLGKTAQALLAAQAAERLPAAGRRAQRRQDQLGPRGGAVDPEPPGDGRPRRRRERRRLRRHRRGQLRHPRPARRLARRARVPRHGRRRGALHQEQDARSARGTCWSSPSASARAPSGRCSWR